MDTSIGKALIMIAGVLLAILVIGFVTQTFNQTSRWASAQDQEQVKEEIEKFNKEWEVYDKDLMYGVDVISCLNKALSNNDKINRIIDKNGEKYDNSYKITVVADLKEGNPLKETVEVYYWKYAANKITRYSYEPDNGPVMMSGAQITFGDLIDFEKLKKKDYMSLDKVKIKANEKLRSLSSTWSISQLKIDENSVKNNTDTYKLLTASDAPSEIIRNKKSDASYAKLKVNDPNKYNNQNGDQYTWSEMEFKSYLYDLKTRKFKCDGLTYSDSGRVSTITFKEL